MSTEQEIAMVRSQLAQLPEGHPNVGHLATILVGLEGEKRAQDNHPLKPLFDVGDVLLTVAPHNILLVLTTSLKPMSSGSARPRIITNPSERGEKTYLREVY
jgi:hypothetical protein